jgi:hypothetical protein
MAELVRDSHTERICPSMRHAGSAAHTAPGRTICDGCGHDAEESLVELPELYDMCAYALDTRPRRPREPVSGHQPRGIVLREPAVRIRSDILGVLASWCGLVTAERGVPGPDELSIPRLSTFVLVHFGWLTAHPAGADFTDELIALAERAREVLQPEPVAELELGPCAHPGCGLPLRADSRPAKLIRCEAGHEWPPERWVLLRGDHFLGGW